MQKLICLFTIYCKNMSIKVFAFYNLHVTLLISVYFINMHAYIWFSILLFVCNIICYMQIVNKTDYCV